MEFNNEEYEKLKKRYGKKLIIKEFILYSYDLPKINIYIRKFIVQRAYIGRKLVAQAANPDLPQRGIFGNNLRSLIISLKNGFAGSCEKISDFIEDFTGETFSQQSIKDCIHRTGEDLESSYKELETELRNSKIVGSDETGWRIDGNKCFLWLFCTMNIVFITIEQSRGRKILAKYFGTAFDGTIISDCYNAYREFAENFQKCWAHLLRTTHNLAKENKNDIRKLHRLLTNLFNELKIFLESNPSDFERKKKYNVFDKKLKKIMNYNWRSKEAKSIIKNRLKSFEGHWLTAVLIPGVDLTNNKTERNIRGVIPTRKLLGCHRTEDGARYFAITESLRKTWKLRGLLPYREMINKFREINLNQAL